MKRVLILCLALTSLAMAQPARELSYGSHPLQKLDIYPSTTNNSPVVVFVHGGGWRSGDKDNVTLNPRFLDFFGKMGVTLVAIDYRLMPEVTFAEQCDDVAASLAWVKNNISRYRADPGRVALFGHSAGAHLVALTAADPSYLSRQNLGANWLKSVVAFDVNAYDVPRAIKTASNLGYPRSARMLPQFFGSQLHTQNQASPVHHLRRGVSQPPYLLVSAKFQGRTPQRLTHDQTEHFGRALNRAGAQAEVKHYSGAHGQMVMKLGHSGHQPSNWMRGFLREHF